MPMEYPERDFRQIMSEVGNHRRSSFEDTRLVRKRLNRLGYEAGDDSFGYIDRPLDRAIRGFQRDNDLKEDGWLRPNGETDRAMRQALAAQKAPKPKHKPDLLETMPTPKRKPYPYRRAPEFEPNNGHANPVDMNPIGGILGKGAVKILSKGANLGKGAGFFLERFGGFLGSKAEDATEKKIDEVIGNNR